MFQPGRAIPDLPGFHSPLREFRPAHRPSYAIRSAKAIGDAWDGTRPTRIVRRRRTSFSIREAAMQVRVKLYASLSRYYGKVAAGVPFEIDLPENATIIDLVDRLKLPKEEVKVFFVKGRARPIDWSLEPGDEVGIFPLIGGG